MEGGLFFDGKGVLWYPPGGCVLCIVDMVVFRLKEAATVRMLEETKAKVRDTSERWFLMTRVEIVR
jgi:hypothetical protein